MEQKNFTSVNNQGFQLKIHNWILSVMFGPGNYVSDPKIRYKLDLSAPMQTNMWDSDDVEIRIWDCVTHNDLFSITNGFADTNIGCVSSLQLAAIISALHKNSPVLDLAQECQEIIKS